MIYNLMYSLNYGYTDDVRCVPFLKILIMGPVSHPAGSLGVHITLTSALFCVRNLWQVLILMHCISIIYCGSNDILNLSSYFIKKIYILFLV